MKQSLLLLAVSFGLFGCGDDSNLYDGVSISSKWDVRTTCQTARLLYKRVQGEAAAKPLYSSKCTISKLTAPIPGIYSYKTPYAASWPNGAAIRVFVDTDGLCAIGVSDNGIPFSWNEDHKAISETAIHTFTESCKTRLNRVGTNVEITSTELYGDNSGGKVLLTFTRASGKKGNGQCLFDSRSVTLVTTDDKSDYRTLNY